MNMEIRMLVALGIGLILMILLIAKTKLHPVMVLIFVSAGIGVAGGMDIAEIGGVIKNGFGNTLGSIGIVIGFGMMMGQIMEKSGAARVMANTFLKLLGKKNDDLALGITGFVVSIPIFADSGYVILLPLVKAISKATKKSIVTLGFALGMGLLLANVCVPPTPGPLAAAGIFEVNMGLFILFSIAMCLPLIGVSTLCARYFGKKYYRIPGNEEGEFITAKNGDERDDSTEIESGDRELPSALVSFMPIIIPLLLIMISSIIGMVYGSGGELPVILKFLNLLGNPIIAVGLGTLAAIYGLVGSTPRNEVMDIMEQGLKGAGMILLVTGAGGALGNIISASGAGDSIAQMLSKSPIPVIVIPFVISAVLRLVQGSGTVAVITAASLTAPILIPMGVNPIFAAFSACIGSQLFAIFNDSFYWLVVRSTGLKTVKEQISAWSFTEFITAFAGLIEILIVNAIFG